MIHLKATIKTFVVFSFMSLTTLPSAAQDLLARQAPIDKKMKAIDTLALNALLEKEQWESPAADLYEEWSNKYTHKVSPLPDEFRINLRGFCMPTPSRVITSNFGARWGRMHKGLDIKVYTGDTIRAAFTGKVRIVRYDANGYGKYVVIRHDNGLETIYGHLSKQLVAENQNVRAGDVIGLGGNTGRSTGSHLHFETRLCGVALNPALFFDFRAQDVTCDTYVFRKSTINRESAQATRLRGKNDQNGYSREDVVGKEQASASRRTEDNSNASSSYSGATRYHKVEAGETVYSIARKHGLTVEEFCRINHINKNMRIRPGQILKY
jgi:murein DD-endopeptidase MepM/ murein hydrolase activator NlpD